MNTVKYKLLKTSFLVLFLSLIQLTAFGQSNEQGYGILVRKANHLKVAIQTAKAMQADSSFQMSAFEIIVCGPLVKELGSQGELANSLEEAQQANIQVQACGLSMKKFQVEPEALHPTVGLVPNGLLRAFELKKAGYHFIDL